MTKAQEHILAVLSSSKGASYSPVQLQKLFFLIDKTVGNIIGGPYFNFEPYHYGPFDKEVYSNIELLSRIDLVDSNKSSSNHRSYRLTVSGQEYGERILSSYPLEYQTYFSKIDEFVRSLSFQELIETIYKHYPETRVNSIFGQ